MSDLSRLQYDAKTKLWGHKVGSECDKNEKVKFNKVVEEVIENAYRYGLARSDKELIHA